MPEIRFFQAISFDEKGSEANTSAINHAGYWLIRDENGRKSKPFGPNIKHVKPAITLAGKKSFWIGLTLARISCPNNRNAEAVPRSVITVHEGFSTGLHNG